MTTLNDVLTFINSNATRADIEAIFDIGNNRIRTLHKQEAAVNAATFKPGDKVQLCGLSPKYLNGCKGVIESRRNGSGFVVKLNAEHEFSRAWTRSINGVLQVPASCVEAVS